jgi:hypothetical protein
MSHSSRRIAVITALAAALAGGAAYAPAAAANNVAWSVSVGGPGFAVSAGQPYWGGYRGYGYGYGYGYHRPWHRPVVPVAYPYGYVAPRPVYVVPRPVYYPAPAFNYYGYYGR